jgi:hypothetical protein
LDDAGMVPKINKSETAVIAAAIDPPG